MNKKVKKEMPMNNKVKKPHIHSNVQPYPLPISMIWDVSYAPALPYKGDWVAITVAHNWNRNPDDILLDVKKVASANAQLCLAYGNWPDDRVTAEQTNIDYFAQRGQIVADSISKYVAAYPNPHGTVYIISNNECTFEGQTYDGSDHDLAYWTNLWSAFFKPIRAAMIQWHSVKVIGYYNSTRTPIQSGVLFDYVSTGCYNMGAKAGGYPHTDLQGHWSVENSVPVGWNDDWQRTIYTYQYGHSGYDYTLSVSQGDLDCYSDSDAWRKAYYDDILDRVVNKDVGVQRVIYYCYNGTNALLYWQKTAEAVKKIHTDPLLRAAWEARTT
jgi:hypothetical protein